MPKPLLTPSLQSANASEKKHSARSSPNSVSHFFIEDDDVSFTQTPEQSFGPISSNQFRTTSKITFSGQKKVYAICQGQLFIQPNAADTTKVNLILKPFRQPVDGISINYFVYRGLNKSDFFTSDVAPVVAGSQTEGTGLNRYLWKQFNDFYAAARPAPSFLADYLGFPSADSPQKPTDKIDQYFFKRTTYTDETNTTESPDFAYELPVVPRGMELGSAKGELGIDLVLDSGDFDCEGGTFPFIYDLAFARSYDHVLTTSEGATAYENKLIKEAAVHFLDIASFYGIHANGFGKLYVNKSTTALRTKAAISSKLSNFNSKNKQYLYIKGNRGRSYNFYGEFSHPDQAQPIDIAILTSADELLSTTYGTQGWPVHVLSNQATVVLQFTAKKTEVTAYVKTGHVLSANAENFISSAELSQRTTSDQSAPAQDYTKPVKLSFEAEGDQAICSFAEIIYDGAHATLTESEQTTVHRLKSRDTVFELVNAIPLMKSQRAEDMPQIVGNHVQLIVFLNSDKSPVNGAVRTKKAIDKIAKSDRHFVERVTYETVLDDLQFSAKQFYKSGGSHIESHVSKFYTHRDNSNRFYRPAPPYSLGYTDFQHGFEQVKGLTLNRLDGALHTKKVVGITVEENQLLVDVIVSNRLNNARIYFSDPLSEQENYVSNDRTKYKIFEVLLSAEATDGTLNIYRPAAKINVFSLDERIYFSKDYSRYIPKPEEALLANFQEPEWI